MRLNFNVYGHVQDVLAFALALSLALALALDRGLGRTQATPRGSIRNNARYCFGVLDKLLDPSDTFSIAIEHREHRL